MSEKRVSAVTRLAIQTYQKIVRTETRIEKLKHELNMWIAQIPENEMDVYLKTTTEIQNKEDEKLEKFLRRLAKRGKGKIKIDY